MNKLGMWRWRSKSQKKERNKQVSFGCWSIQEEELWEDQKPFLFFLFFIFWGRWGVNQTKLYCYAYGMCMTHWTVMLFFPFPFISLLQTQSLSQSHFCFGRRDSSSFFRRKREREKSDTFKFQRHQLVAFI